MLKRVLVELKGPGEQLVSAQFETTYKQGLAR